jgi:hypothetical protein
MSRFASAPALLIGVGEYQNPAWNALVTVRDAQAVASALTDPAVSGYPSDQVELLYNEQATRDRIIKALQRLAERTTQSDTVLIFFCGHGALGTDGIYYFATHETDFVGKRVQAGKGLSSIELIALLRTINAKKLLFIINACFSGYLSPTLAPTEILGTPPAATFSIEVLASGEGRALITASRPSQYSYYQQDQKLTFFGQALVDGLHGKAAKSGGYIGLYELYQYLYTSVKAAAATVNGVQEPVLTILQHVGSFPVALYPGAISTDLGTESIKQTPPTGMEVEIIPRSLAQAIGQDAQAINRQSSGTVNIDLGTSNRMGNIQIGDVAGRDIIKVDTANAASSDTKRKLLTLISDLQSEVTNLTSVPKGKRQDAEDELRKAKEAGEEGDKERLLEKLESAQRILVAIGSSIPVAFELGKTIGAVLQQAMAIFP